MTVAVDNRTSGEENPTGAKIDGTTEVSPYLGGEKPLFDQEREVSGLEEILATLSKAEVSEFPDPSMPIRHFRAEKVRTILHSLWDWCAQSFSFAGQRTEGNRKDTKYSKLEKEVWSRQGPQCSQW